ncbi:hypothetical protein HJC10_03290 [Corallococcus exiguus]|nr:hypothetical protein [Corallococcus exiguus]
MATTNPPSTQPTTPNEISLEQAQNLFREFLETYPLFRPLKINLEPASIKIEQDERDLLPNTIHLHCTNERCSLLEHTTWTRYRGASELVLYTCANCGKSEARYWYKSKVTERVKLPSTEGSTIAIKAMEFSKIGQWPTWAPKIPNRLLKNLGPSAILFRRGVSCLQEGLGIGASAYFRRVIEEEVKSLLDLSERAAILDEDNAALDNIRLARESQVASERLKIAVQKVPRSLRPGNTNPLAVLYGALSGAVHQEPEDVALATASRLLKTFIFLFEELKERMDAAEAYASELNKMK